MPASKTVILVNHDGMGHGPTTLQHTLITKYLQILLDDGKYPAAICFYGSGVKLVCEGSPALESLRALEAQGVLVIACTTCLNTYELADKRRVGLAGGMGDIIEAQWRADKVITL